MLYEANFTYDSSMPIYDNKPPSFPYTMDYKLSHDCMIPPCPNKVLFLTLLLAVADCAAGLPRGVGAAAGDVERSEGGAVLHGGRLQ